MTGVVYYGGKCDGRGVLKSHKFQNFSKLYVYF